MCFTNPSLGPAGPMATEARPLAEGRCGHPRTHSPPACPPPKKQPVPCSPRPFLFHFCSAPACGLSARAGAPGGERAAWPGLLAAPPALPAPAVPDGVLLMGTSSCMGRWGFPGAVKPHIFNVLGDRCFYSELLLELPFLLPETVAYKQ